MALGEVRVRRSRRSSRGVTLIEVTMSTVLVAMILVASLRSVGAAIRSQAYHSRQLRAELLADQLMSEIQAAHYKEPTSTVLFGPESGEPATNVGPRTAYDDVDDYHLWNRSPPVFRNGAVIPDHTGWRRMVTVQWVNPANPSLVSNVDQGLKRVTITVSHQGETLARCVFLRSDRYGPR